MYEERVSRVVSAVVWCGGASSSANTRHRVLPDGCMDLLWVRGTLLVAGPDTTGYVTSWPVGARIWGLRFASGTAPALLGVAAHEVRDRVVPLDDIMSPARVRRFVEYVDESDQRGAALERIAADLAAQAEPPDPRVLMIARRARAGTPVERMAATIGVGERRLLRWSRAAFGYGPKTLVRILRMNRALASARDGVPMADAAITAGYADQAHMARDVRGLAGVPPSALIR